jgi:hypothetical protein
VALMGMVSPGNVWVVWRRSRSTREGWSANPARLQQGRYPAKI